MSKKIILGILGLLVVVGAYYFFSNPAQKTEVVLNETPPIVVPIGEKESVTIPSDWKTYQNNIRGYAISYPPSWYVDEISDKSLRIASTPTSTNMNGTGWPSGVWVDIFDSHSTDTNSEAICQDTHGEYVSVQYAPNLKSKCYGKPMSGIEVSSNVYPKDMGDNALLTTLDNISNSFHINTLTGKVLHSEESPQFRSFPEGISTDTPYYLHFAWEGEDNQKLILEDWDSRSIIKTFSNEVATELRGTGEFPTQIHGGILNPKNNDELFLSKTVFQSYYPNPCAFTRSFYVLDIDKEILTKFYEDTELGIPEDSPRFCTDPVIFGRDGSKLLFWYHTPETSGPCSSPWAMGSRVHYLDLSGLSGGIKPYLIPEDLRLQGEKEVKLCQGTL